MNDEKCDNEIASGKKAQSPAQCEDEFLLNQANAARSALRRAVGDTGRSLVQCMDIRTWTKQYPLRTTISACVFSFCVTQFVIRRPQESKHERKRMAEALRASRAAQSEIDSLASATRKSDAVFRLMRRWAWQAMGIWGAPLFSQKSRETQYASRPAQQNETGQPKDVEYTDESATIPVLEAAQAR